MSILSKQATKEQEVLCDSNYIKICLCKRKLKKKKNLPML